MCHTNCSLKMLTVIFIFLFLGFSQIHAQNKPVDNRDTTASVTKASKDLNWGITFDNGEFIENVKPIELVERMLYVKVEGEKRGYPVYGIIGLTVPPDRMSNLGHGAKNGFLFPFRKSKNMDIEKDPDTSIWVFLIFLPIYFLMYLFIFSIFGIIGAFIGGFVGVVENSPEYINLYNMTLAEKLETIINLLN